MFERYLRWVQKNEDTFRYGTWEEKIRLAAFTFIVCLVGTPVVLIVIGLLVWIALA
jgi:hypothetical protein